jgi:hypothetical protein
MSFEFQNVVMHILKFFLFLFLCLVFSKDAIKISTYYIPIILVIHHFFGWKVMKSGSLGMCVHPFPTMDCCVGECNSTFQCSCTFAITFPISNVHLPQNGKHFQPLSNSSVCVPPIFNNTKPILIELFHLEYRCTKLMSSLKANWQPYPDFSNMFNQCWGFQLKWPTHQHPCLGNYIPNCRPWCKHMTLHQSPIWTLRIHTLCLDGWNLLMQNLKKNLELTFT